MKPKLLTAVLTSNIASIPKNNLVAYNTIGEPLLFVDALLNYDDLKILIDNNDGIIGHIINKEMHWSPADRRDYIDFKNRLNLHTTNLEIHVTQTDKNNWNSKETETGAQLKADAVKELLNIHSGDLDVHVTKLEKDRWNNTYTREETANLVSSSSNDTYWKPAVPTYADLAITYPNAKPGWICTELEYGVTYRFVNNLTDDAGTLLPPQWILAFRNSVPMATANNAGQMSAEYYSKLTNIEFNANHYIHPDNVNCRHVSDAEKKIWSNKAPKDIATIFASGLMSPFDKDKLDTVEKYANSYTHPDKHEPTIIAQNPTNRFVTDKQISLWNDKPTGKLASDVNDGQMSSADFVKLFGIDAKANYYVHPAKHSSSDIAQDIDNRFVSDAQISIWNNKEDKNQAQYRADKALEQSKAYTDQIIKAAIGIAPSLLDTFEELARALGNDPNFAATMTIELSNKVDKTTYSEHIRDTATHLTADDRRKFDTVQANANFYTHPNNHPASMISTDTNNRFISDVERSEWNAKANGDLATELTPGQMSAAMVKKLNAITTTGKIQSNFLETDPNAGSFIMNKPLGLPAIGGNSETVGGYSAIELINSRKASTIVIGTSTAGFSDKDVDFLCNGTNDSTIINAAFMNLKELGGSVVFREGLYLTTTPLSLNRSNVVVKGSGAVTLECRFSTNDATLSIIGDKCAVENIKFKGSTSNTKCYGLKVVGNNNIVENCDFTIGGGIKLSSGTFNKITENTFNTGKIGILSNILVENSMGNILSNNTIIDYNTGIEINSTTNKTNGNNIVSENVLYNCDNGVLLTNELVTNNTINNVISHNTIMRGTGATSDYLYEQHTIRILKGAYNIVMGNVVRGRAVVDEGTNNTIVNNVSV